MFHVGLFRDPCFLFGILITNTDLSIMESHIFFADDTSLVMHDNDLNILVNHVSLTFQERGQWWIENKLTISMKKYFFLFNTPNKPLVRHVRKIATENMVINRVDGVNYLGITIDEKLTWNSHVEYICNSLITVLVSLKQLRHKVTINSVRQLYLEFIYSKIKYGMAAYDNT